MPSRPDWNCQAPGCGEPWPCTSQRAELLRTYRHAHSPLRIYMASYMYDAIEDAVRHPSESEIDFWHRFMGWVPRLPHPILPPVDQEMKGDPTRAATPTTERPCNADHARCTPDRHG